MKTITITVNIQNNDEYNSSTTSSITLSLDNPIELAMACNYVSREIISNFNCDESIDESNMLAEMS